ncbi:DUF6612 family protein [Bacillus sp. FJAT-27445]|uniref:DUF6612 family protein n=1 Tax=Bacillus sp. FJAT-27445 TaxID=1679166 RepID=UPI000743E909|nr:DUF6612 family protein [Bacillus sp. FJAT-27445]
MKKYRIGMIGLALLLLTASCSINREDSREKATAPDYTPKQVISKAEMAFEKLRGLSVNLEISQHMQGYEAGSNVNLDSKIQTDILTEPVAFHQTSEIKNALTGEVQLSEAYYTNEGMFLYDGSRREWKRYSPEIASATILPFAQMNPAAELHTAEGLSETLSMTKTSEEYIVTLTANGGKHEEELKKIIMGRMPAILQRNKEFLERMKITAFNYELAVNKKSFLPSRFNARAEIVLFNAGNSVTMKQEMEGFYKNFNKIREISVPESIQQLAGE